MNRNQDEDRRLAELMRSAQDGDNAAYARLLAEVTPLLRQSVRCRCRLFQPSDVEDIVQDILLSLHAARATYDSGRPFLPWLMAIVRHRTADAARRRARRSMHEIAVAQPPETLSLPDAETRDTVPGDPEALRRAIHELPRGQREAVVLLKLHEMSLKEAAMSTGTSVGALKVAVHRAVRSLRTVLTDTG